MQGRQSKLEHISSALVLTVHSSAPPASFLSQSYPLTLPTSLLPFFLCLPPFYSLRSGDRSSKEDEEVRR
eukprot:7284726-Pyramimonas_sp.AAC.1